MAETWSSVCLHCVDLVRSAPVYITLGSLLASTVGVFVLVSLLLRGLSIQMLTRSKLALHLPLYRRSRTSKTVPRGEEI